MKSVGELHGFVMASWYNVDTFSAIMSLIGLFSAQHSIVFDFLAVSLAFVSAL